ncbi:MAG: hypothetical protein FWG83_02720, partial [Oscillospiraceae bacterium]|nr:hypothetical protein [Oscillospiraceae bacterium]
MVRIHCGVAKQNKGSRVGGFAVEQVSLTKQKAEQGLTGRRLRRRAGELDEAKSRTRARGSDRK